MSYNLTPLADRVTTILRTIPRPGAPFGERRSPTGTERRSVSPSTSPLEDVLAGRPHVEAS